MPKGVPNSAKKPRTGMKPKMYYLPLDVIERLQRYARARGVTEALVVRTAIIKFLHEENVPVFMPPPLPVTPDVFEAARTPSSRTSVL